MMLQTAALVGRIVADHCCQYQPAVLKTDDIDLKL
jgi:hypothetical protein